MPKIYPIFLLLFWSTAAYAQSSALTPVYTTPDSSLILDFAYGKALTVKQNGASFTYRIVDVSTGSAVTIPFTGNYRTTYTEVLAAHPAAWITPSGALIWGQSRVNSNINSLYEYKQGAFTTLSENVSAVKPAGAYVVWVAEDSTSKGLLRRNTETGQQELLVPDSAFTDINVATNGRVVYTIGRNLYTYYNGLTSLVDYFEPCCPDYPTLPGSFFGVQTDGERITYLSQEEQSPVIAYLYDHDSVTVLQVNNQGGGTPDFNLTITSPLINNGYIGGIYLPVPWWYMVRGDVYTRDPQGTTRNVLPIAFGSEVGFANMITITPHGDIAVKTVSRQLNNIYIISQDGSLNRQVSDAPGYAYYDDSTWFVTDGRSLFSVNLDTLPNHYITPILKQMYTRTRLPLPASEFLAHYIGPDSGVGRLESIQITKRPGHGVLTNQYGQPISQENLVVTRANLDTIRYSATSFPGKDTIRWRAFDGMNWTNDTAIYITILPPPDTIKPFERTTIAPQPIRFWSSNFKQSFTGKLAGIRVNRLPIYGKLTIGGKQLFYERSRDVTLAELDSMYYTPNPGIVGVDTLQWMAYNGIEYTKNDTPAILRIYPDLTTPPILRTLETSYSKSGTPDTILIANYPKPNWHTDVIVLLDNNQVLPVNPDYTFIIDPTLYNTGTHQLKVTFKHKWDSISIHRSFTITAPLMANLKQSYLTEETFTVSPNPFTAQLTINGLSWKKDYILRVYDAQGKLVFTDRSFGQNRKVLQIGNRVKGMYYLQIYDIKSKAVIKTIQLLHL